jgi:N-methylhydantoinase A
MEKIRVGIDVGGTFTHAVAINHDTMELMLKVKVPTTHSAPEGVARGIIDSIHILLEKGNIQPENVIFIAHSTTQATNALLEGDVSKVGIIGMGNGGMESAKAKLDTAIDNIQLAPGKFIQVCHTFLNSADLSEQTIDQALSELSSMNAEVLVAAEAFSVDNPVNENVVLERAEQRNLYGTGSHEISQLYGLRTRTTTAVINASILPKMLATADTTESSVTAAGIKAPLMIMRGDGGAMTINDMRQRPILTMLSGPAAGVAGALMYEKVSYGIFLEVGGTSTDMSAIKNGNVMVEYAEVGGHRTYLRSLDTRTVGIAGGSMIAVKDGCITDVGPRSAHIAGLPYAVFAEEDLIEPKVILITPRPGDPQYVAVETKDGKRYALTLTCAANALGLTKPEDTAYGNPERARQAFAALASYIDTSIENAAAQVMDKAANKIIPVVKALWSKYEMDPDYLTLVGGGGGATAIVPYVAQKMKLQYKTASNADVISSIGVALAMVRDVLEKSIINPTPDDILRIRKEAEDKVIRMGANPESVEVQIEIDPQKNIVRAVAMGALAMRKKKHEHSLSVEEQKVKAAETLHATPDQVELAGQTPMFSVFTHQAVKKKAFGLFKVYRLPVRVVDEDGIIRLAVSDGKVINETMAGLDQRLPEIIRGGCRFGDGGQTIPDVFILVNGKILNFTGMQDIDQICALAGVELFGYGDEEAIVIVLGLKDA